MIIAIIANTTFHLVVEGKRYYNLWSDRVCRNNEIRESIEQSKIRRSAYRLVVLIRQRGATAAHKTFAHYQQRMATSAEQKLVIKDFDKIQVKVKEKLAKKSYVPIRNKNVKSLI